VNIGVLLDLQCDIDERNYNGDTANEVTDGPQVLNIHSHSPLDARSGTPYYFARRVSSLEHTSLHYQEEKAHFRLERDVRKWPLWVISGRSTQV
jgi:hypothetical protein